MKQVMMAAAGLVVGLGLAGCGMSEAGANAPEPPAAETGAFTPEVFELWIDARAGSGEPVYWYSTGTVRAFPSGETIALMEGYDAAVSHRPEGPDAPRAHQYNRKIYIFRDPQTGEVLREVDGVAVDPVAYDYQFIDYRVEDGELIATVEQGAAPRVQTIEAEPMSWRLMGDTYVFTAPLFLDFPIPGTDRRIQAWENYDFFIHPEGSVDEPHQLSWARIGQLPAWAGGQMAVMHLHTWRVEDYGDIPAGMRAYIEAEAPLWRVPPADLAEIRRIQAGED